MIYVTGDCHGDFRRFHKKMFYEQSGMTKKDYVIILGDFGGVWCAPNDLKNKKTEDHILDELDQRNFTTLFIPGNHENYARLLSDEFETREWNGGNVKLIRPSGLMLMRGEMFEIDGLKIFAFGGAESHDISDGILDGNDPDWMEKSRKLDRLGKYMHRVKGISWWEQEMPDEKEMQHGIETLVKNNWKCDIVLTHCAPASVQALAGYHDTNAFISYLEKIRQRLEYKNWFFGHYHENKNVTYKDILLYEQIVRIW